MKQKICFLALVALLCSPLGSLVAAGAENDQEQNPTLKIFISEIGWAGSSKSSLDEWLELVNPGSQEIYLSGWQIEGAGTGGSTLTLPEGAKILPGATYLIANYGSEHTSSTLSSPVNYINSGLSLSNSSFRLILKDSTAVLIDEAGDNGPPFFGGTNSESTVAMVRIQPIKNGTSPEAWQAAETSQGFDTDSQDLGTPGLWGLTVGDGVVAEEEKNVEIEEDLGPEEIFEGEETNESKEISEPEEDIVFEIVEEAEVAENRKQTETQEEEFEEIKVFDSETSGGTEMMEKDEEEMTETSQPEEIIVIDSENLEEEELFDASTHEATHSSQEEGFDETTGERTAIEISEILEEDVSESETEETSNSTSTNTTTGISYPKGTLTINEFVADPISGEKEWVEIFNPYNNVIPLSGWKISEGSGRQVAFPEIWLGFGQTAVVEFSTGALNNDSDTIRLLDPAGNIIDEVTYGQGEIPTTTDPNSVAKNTDGKFVVTETPTKNFANLVTITVKPEETKTSEKKAAEETLKETKNMDSEISTASENKNEVAIEETNETKTVSELPAIRLSELYPNTDGTDATDEFIELENYGNTSIDLFEISLKDAGGNSWSLKTHQELAAGQFTTFKRGEFQFALNNSGSETVSLYAADGRLLDQTQYENAPKKFSYARDGELWRWTPDLTPNEPNQFPETLGGENSGMVQTNESAVNLGRIVATKSVARVSISEARSLEKDSRVIVEGLVSAAPGQLGNQIFYLSGDGSGIQIYKSNSDFPDLEIGDRLELSGTISTNRDEPRIKIGKDDTITVLENSVPLAIFEPETIGQETAGQLVRLSGLVTEKSSTQYSIETAGGIFDVKIKDGTEIKLTEIKPGDKITTTGIVGQSEEKFFLLPRTQEDIQKEIAEEPLVTASDSPILTGKAAAEKSKQTKALTIGLLTVLGLTIYAIRNRQKRNRKPYEKIRQLSPATAERL